jgi:hypothetical protein
MGQLFGDSLALSIETACAAWERLAGAGARVGLPRRQRAGGRGV